MTRFCRCLQRHPTVPLIAGAVPIATAAALDPRLERAAPPPPIPTVAAISSGTGVV